MRLLRPFTITAALLLLVSSCAQVEALVGPNSWEPISLTAVEAAAYNADPSSHEQASAELIEYGWPADVSVPAFLGTDTPSRGSQPPQRKIAFYDNSKYDVDEIARYVALLYEQGFRPDLNSARAGFLVREDRDWIVIRNAPAKGDWAKSEGLWIEWTNDATAYASYTS